MKKKCLNHVQTQFLWKSNTPTWRFIVDGAYLKVDLLQVSILVNKQKGGEKKKKREGNGKGERDL